MLLLIDFDFTCFSGLYITAPRMMKAGSHTKYLCIKPPSFVFSKAQIVTVRFQPATCFIRPDTCCINYGS